MEALDRGGRTFARRSLAHPSASPARAGRHAAASAGVDRVVCLLKAIAHPMRLRIAALLCDGELHVDAIARQLGVQPNTVSQQLRILRAVEIVVVRRGGGFA